MDLKQKQLEISERVNEVLMETLKLNQNVDESDSEDSDEGEDYQIRNYLAQCKYFIPYKVVLGGSVAYGLPTLAVTRRTTQNIKKLKEIEEINKKLCQVMRVPNDFIEIVSDTQNQ